MADVRQARGRLGETAAQTFLERQGFVLVDVNVRVSGEDAPRGELDIVAWDGPTLCFIEVKTRQQRVGETPAEAVTPAKQRQIHRLALAYVNRAGLLADDVEIPFRFDVVAVEIAPDGRHGNESSVRGVQLIRGAFLAPEE